VADDLHLLGRCCDEESRRPDGGSSYFIRASACGFGLRLIYMASNATCYIWGTTATSPKDSDGENDYIDSPRAGGRYAISGSAVASMGKLTPAQRAALTTWLCDQRKAGIEYPKITSYLIDQAKSFPRMRTSDRMDRAMLYFNERLRIGENIYVFGDGQFSDADVDASHLAARTECLDKNELFAFLRFLNDMGYVSQTEAGHTGRTNYTPTVSGWLKIDELITHLPISSQAFVAMWFHDSTQTAYEAGIQPAIVESGYNAIRIDNKDHVNKIDDEIIAEIRRSKFLVADFTCEKGKVRGGVYYEAGYAMALPIPVIWTVRADSVDDLHFDTRQYNHIVWDSPEALKQKLKARIGAVIGNGPLLAK
jgi:hypothetical protein